MEHTSWKERSPARGHRATRVAASLALAAAVVGASAWLSATLLFPTGDPGTAPTTTEAKRGSLTDTVTGTGKLAAASSATVTAPVDGTVSEVRVASGQQVAAGDVLFAITNPQLDQDVDAAQAALASAQADQRAAAGDLRRARAAAKDGTDESAAALDQARAASEKADAASTAARQALEAARARADARTVRAPAAGTVMSLAVSPGTSVQAQSGTALAEIGDLTRLRVSLAVNEVDVPKVAVGQKAEVTFPAVDGLRLEGTVTDVATQATAGKDSGSVVTYDVGLVIDAPDPRLKPGMSAIADIAAQTLEDALVVPAGAVRTDADGNQTVEVWVPGRDGAEGRTEIRKVKILLKTDDGAAVEGDLAEGDQVVTSAAARGGE